MARVAVLHNTLDLRGGADAVCLHVCEALQDVHDVTLVTLGQSSLTALNDLFGTEAAVAVHRPRGSGFVSQGLDLVAGRVGPALALRSLLLRSAFLRRVATFDLAVSTANEFALPLPSVQYVHFPQYNLQATPVATASPGNRWLTRLSGLGDRHLPEDATLLANSGWTADVVETIYGRRPTVRYPPIDPIPAPTDWADREPGLVTLGRLAPDNRTLDAVRILDGLLERGRDVHLHIVGSAAPAYRDYVRRIKRTAASREAVTVEIDAPRSRVRDLLSTHRYGLNTKPNEHFGMAVAEFVAAGMLPFAPDSGGQREILDHDERLLFPSVPAAIDRIDTAIEADRRPQLPRDRFDSDRFAGAIRNDVDAALARHVQ